jgi:hypothetical protein
LLHFEGGAYGIDVIIELQAMSLETGGTEIEIARLPSDLCLVVRELGSLLSFT